MSAGGGGGEAAHPSDPQKRGPQTSPMQHAWWARTQARVRARAHAHLVGRQGHEGMRAGGPAVWAGGQESRRHGGGEQVGARKQGPARRWAEGRRALARGGCFEGEAAVVVAVKWG